MIVVGLTGGIGSGKSTVSDGLVARGAELLDADAVTRSLQAPGQPVFEAMVARFGPGIVSDDGFLDRAAVAALVFEDEAALADLNAIVHPAVGTELRRRLAALAGSASVVVLDIPLLAEGARRGKPPRYEMNGVIVVDTPIGVAIERLVAYRGFSDKDARARVARQASRTERVMLADLVIDNSGDRELLQRQLDRAWRWIEDLPSVPGAVADTEEMS